MVQGAGYGTFIFFGAFAVLSVIWAYFVAPETKGKTLEEIDQLFHNSASHDEVAAKQMIVTAICAGSPYLPSWASGQQVDSLDKLDGKDGTVQTWVEKV